MKKVVCSFSGGRDSALACYLARHVARQWRAEFRLLFIDTGTALPETRRYVEEYAKWLDAPLDVARTEIDYWEGVKRWGYPLLWHNRWCFGRLKREPLIKYLRKARPDVVVLGIRAEESLFREREWRDKVFYRYCWENKVCAKVWLPVYHFTSHDVERYIKLFNIPRSPVWRLGFSGECLCMAGMSKSKLDALISAYPEVAREMAERDREVQIARRSGPAYPAPLIKIQIPLHKYVEERLKTPTLLSYIEYSSCMGRCLLVEH